jgi:hypothetical protein
MDRYQAKAELGIGTAAAVNAAGVALPVSGSGAVIPASCPEAVGVVNAFSLTDQSWFFFSFSAVFTAGYRFVQICTDLHSLHRRCPKPTKPNPIGARRRLCLVCVAERATRKVAKLPETQT